MSKEKRELLTKLKFELAFIEDGGYGRSVRTPHRSTSPFQDSLTCLNLGDPLRSHPCSECLLMQYVPESSRGEDIPCHLWFPEIRIWLIHWELSVIRFVTPASTLGAILAAVRDCLRTRAALQIEVLALRHQLNVLQRSVKRPKLTAADRFLWARLSRFWAGWPNLKR